MESRLNVTSKLVQRTHFRSFALEGKRRSLIGRITLVMHIQQQVMMDIARFHSE